MISEIKQKLEALPGQISFYYQNLETKETYGYQQTQKMMAASVIKLFVMTEAFARIDQGLLSAYETVAVKRSDWAPSCGALTYMHEGIQVTVMDLITLMIIFSDNTATNILIDRLGMAEINHRIRSLGYEDTWLRRKMFDLEKSQAGIQNIITAEETGRLLEAMYEGRLISPEASSRMLEIMKQQQLNGKIPFYLKAVPEKVVIAHKTGEDRGITHDVGIIFAKQPFVVCFCGNETDTPAFERVMAELSLQLYEAHSRM